MAMKALLFASLLLFVSRAAEASPPNWTLQIDPLTTALGLAHLHVEYAFAEHHSLYLSPSIRLLNSPFNDDDYDALGVEAGYRYFLHGRAPIGFWMQTRGLLSRLSTETETTLGGYLSALGGYTWQIRRHYILSLGIGVQYVDLSVANQGTKGLLPAAHTAFGIAF